MKQFCPWEWRVRGASAVLLLLCLASSLLPVPCGHAAGVSIVDDSGQTVTLSSPARRIIPLYAGLGETLAAMGLADRIVGRTVSDDTLPQELPTVGTHMRPNPELIAGLRPDLVLQLEGREEAGLAAQGLMRLGIPVARFRVASFADLFSCMERLGALTGEGPAAERLIGSMRARLDRVQENQNNAMPGPVIFFEVRYPNLLGAGGGSMVTDIIRHAGGVNCLGAYPERMVRLSEEALALEAPDIYLVQQGPMNKAPVPVSERPHFKELEAVRKGFVSLVPESRFSRPGPQSVDAVEDLAAIILAWRANRNR